MKISTLLQISAAYVSASRRSSACPAKHQCNEDFCGKNALSWAAQLRGDDVQCKPGVAHLWDECDCCQKCARQHGEKCDMMNPCDHTKGLACLKEGDEFKCDSDPKLKKCFISGFVKSSGDEFYPNPKSCQLTCVCVDGDIGCYPTCAQKPPKNCLNPRYEESNDPSACCGEWTCGSADRPQTRPLKIQKSVFGAAHRKVPKISYNSETKCMVQTTEWSECSRNCGWGVRERVTNNNEECEMKKETKLCQVRPCDASHSIEIENLFKTKPRLRNKMCLEKVRVTEPIQFEFSGCRSDQKYRPRYCGSCKNDYCCKPSKTETIDVDFTCDENGKKQRFTKQMDKIISCECSNQCGDGLASLFSSIRPLSNDVYN